MSYCNWLWIENLIRYQLFQLMLVYEGIKVKCKTCTGFLLKLLYLIIQLILHVIHKKLPALYLNSVGECLKKYHKGSTVSTKQERLYTFVFIE